MFIWVVNGSNGNLSAKMVHPKKTGLNLKTKGNQLAKLNFVVFLASLAKDLKIKQQRILMDNKSLQIL